MSNKKIASGPPSRSSTARQRIFNILKATQEPLSAKDISFLAHVSEKDVHIHIDHLRRSAKSGTYRLEMVAAHCLACGFEFAKRERATSPGRCPLCKSSRVNPPLFLLNYL